MDSQSNDGTTDFTWDNYDPVDDTDADVSGDDDSHAAMGRISKADWDAINQGLVEVRRQASLVAAKTGLSSSQVFKQWTLASRRTHVGRNMWNLYSKYFKDHQAQELARLEYGEYQCLLQISNNLELN